jgi:hypothetical protein
MERAMTTLDGPLPPGAAEPIDEFDVALLDGMRDLFEAIDPMPADLVERVRFSLALENLDVEVFRRFEEPALAGAARGHEESRTITFDSESLTIMVSITPTGYDVVRLDGWLAPPGGHEVELRTARGPITTTADDQGRFAIDDVPHGLAQLVVRPIDHQPAGLGRSVVTPAIVV